jgi:hypothetical protein
MDSGNAFSQESLARIESARRMAAILAEHPSVRAVMVTGSVAEGLADAVSDVDMTVYYDALPPEEEIHRTRTRVGGSEYVMYFGSVEEGGIVESYWIDGVRHDFAHVTIEGWERDIEEVLTKHPTDTPLQKALAGTLIGIPLHGAELIARWKERIARYPHGLALAMVRAHLRFRPRWVLPQLAFERGDTLFLQEELVAAVRNILGVLLGINRVYHWGEYKRLEHVIATSLPTAPTDLHARLETVLGADRHLALAELDLLIEELFALVGRTLPELAPDVADKRTRYLRPYGS